LPISRGTPLRTLLRLVLTASAAGRMASTERGRSGGKIAGICMWLRWADERAPVSACCCLTGSSLLMLGVGSGLSEVLASHPYFLAVAAGFFFLVLAAVSHKEGLVRLLPKSVQDTLLRRTPFDLLSDESELSNILRRWGRILMLCQNVSPYGERSEAEVQAVVRGLDPEFLEAVFRRGVVHALPATLRRVLLPDKLLSPTGPLQQTRPACRWPSRAVGVGSLLWRPPWAAAAPPASPEAVAAAVGGSTPLSAAGIRELLRGKAEDKRLLARVPALSPVVRTHLLEALLSSFGRPVAQQGLQLAVLATAATAGAWTASAAFFCTPAARNTLRLVAFGGEARMGSGERASRAAFFGAGVSLLGAGFCLALALRIQQRWLPRAASSLASTTAAATIAPSAGIGGGGCHAAGDLCGTCRQEEQVPASAQRASPTHAERRGCWKPAMASSHGLDPSLGEASVGEPEQEESPENSSLEQEKLQPLQEKAMEGEA